MGEADRYHITDKNASFQGSFNSLNKNIIALVAVIVCWYMLLMIIYLGYISSPAGERLFVTDILENLALPNSLSLYAHKWWTIFLYGITYGPNEVLMMLADVILLWVLGTSLNNNGYSKNVIPLFFMATIVGAVFFLLFATSMPTYSTYILNAHMGIMGLLGACWVWLQSVKTLYFINKNGLSFRYVVGIAALLVLAGSFIDKFYANTIAYTSAFLIGIMSAWLYSKKNVNVFLPLIRTFKLLDNLIPNSIPKKPVKNTKVFYNTKGTPPFKKRLHYSEEKLNEILDKINAQGINALTAAEKDFLKTVSHKNNSN